MNTLPWKNSARAEALQAALARRILQMQPDALHILLQHRVIEVVWVAVQLLGYGIAQAALLTRGQR